MQLMYIVHIAFLVDIVEELGGGAAFAPFNPPMLAATEFVLIKGEVDCAKHLAQMTQPYNFEMPHPIHMAKHLHDWPYPEMLAASCPPC